MDSWDVCAGVALVTAAGGSATDMSGASINLKDSKLTPGLLVGGPGQADFLRQIVQ